MVLWFPPVTDDYMAYYKNRLCDLADANSPQPGSRQVTLVALKTLHYMIIKNNNTIKMLFQSKSTYTIDDCVYLLRQMRF